MALDSRLSRRGMVVGLAGTAAAGTVAVQQSTGVKAFRELLRPTDKAIGGLLAKGTSGDWALEVGSHFTVHTGHVLKLIDVQRYPKKDRRPRNIRSRGFVARFDVVKGGVLPANTIYRVNHRSGAFDIFLTAGKPNRPLRMFAEFN
jgi:hypothetical protein